MLQYKASKRVRNQYKLNTHHLTVLFTCYVYNKYLNDTFVIYNILQLLNSYNSKRLGKYINSLVSIGLIALAGARKYKLTPEGFQVIQSISVNMDQVLYKFCNDHDIEL